MVDRASSSITIDADKSAVMAVIADFDSYPEWVSSLKSAEVVEGGGPDGRAQQVRFQLDAGILKDDYTLAYDWDGDDAVNWHLVTSKAMKAQDGAYTLRDNGGRTDVTYELSVEINLPMLGMFKRKAEKMIMDTALKDLKKRVESR